MSSGSVDSLKLSLRCGRKPKARQMRATLLRLRPTRFASDRVLQCVASRGVLSRVRHCPLDCRVADLARRAGPRLVQQPING